MKKKICKFCGGRLEASSIESCGKSYPAWKCAKCGTMLPRVPNATEEASELLARHSAAVEKACKELAANGMSEAGAVLIWLNPKGRNSALEKVRELTYWLDTIAVRMRFAMDHPISRAAGDMRAFCERRNIEPHEDCC